MVKTKTGWTATAKTTGAHFRLTVDSVEASWDDEPAPDALKAAKDAAIGIFRSGALGDDSGDFTAELSGDKNQITVTVTRK